MNSVSWIILPTDVAMMGAVIAAWGVATIFLYREGQFYRHPDQAFTKRFHRFDWCVGVAAACALLSFILAALQILGVTETRGMTLLSGVLAVIGFAFIVATIWILRGAVADLATRAEKKHDAHS